jgi:hypothetical protein
VVVVVGAVVVVVIVVVVVVAAVSGTVVVGVATARPPNARAGTRAASEERISVIGSHRNEWFCWPCGPTAINGMKYVRPIANG